MIHLHVHSHFSFLDGSSSPDELAARAQALDMPALALTDHHGLYGAVRFVHAAKRRGIKPIVGVELCLAAPGKPHLVLLARDRTGYANLCRIVTRAQLEHQDDPQIALDAIVPHRNGLIALSGCRRGEIATSLLAGRPDDALSAARRYAEIFGADFWIELQNHLLPDDAALVEASLDLAAKAGLRCVLTNDVHYATPNGYRLRDVLTCVAARSSVDDWNPERHANAEYYLKDDAEMRAAFGLDRRIFDACRAATEEIAAACKLDLLATESRPPDYPVPNGETAFSYLHDLCQKGVRQRYRPITPEVTRQLAHELSVIEEMGLASFFLCVWDIVRFAREKGIRCAGRGSAADSIVAYVLGVTAVDPLAHNLLFERFLNPGRIGMPDIDIDFDSRRRDEVIEYIENRYGTEHAAMVANVITYRSRSAFRDIAKALGFAPALVDHLAGKLGYRSVRSMRDDFVAAGVLPPRGNSDAIVADNPLEQVVALCEQMDGYPRHLSLHNGGMLITAEPLTETVPLEYATSGVRVCQFNKDDVEMLGLIKFDILGLRTLSIVDEAVQSIRRAKGIDVPIDDLSLDDPAVYDLMCSSKTIGVFQIESPGQWALLARAQPRTFGDLIIQIALFRPGPLQGGMVNPFIERSQGREPVTYPHPSLEASLRDTLGVVIFQEQVLQVAHDFAGLSFADADGLRRAMSHYRLQTEMDACRDIFVAGAVKLGRDRTLAEQIYEMIAYFSGYGFCRSHAAAFAKTVYQTAFLKVYYPAHLLAAILSNEPCCYYPTQTVIEEARRWGIPVLPVDINRSGARYLVEGKAIRMGFLQVKGLSEEVGEAIASARRPFSSLADFWERTTLPRDVVENLIAVGAFDSLSVGRRKLLWQLEEVVRTVPRSGSQIPGRWNAGGILPKLPPLTQLDLAALDFSVQGASARHSIMPFYRRALDRVGVLSIGRLQAEPTDSVVLAAGVLVSRQQPPTANGMTFLVLADEEGELPVAVPPPIYGTYRQTIDGSQSLVVEGRVQRTRYLTSLLATRCWRLADVAQPASKPALPNARRSLPRPR